MNPSEMCDSWVLSDISLGQNAAYLNTAENESAMCNRDDFPEPLCLFACVFILLMIQKPDLIERD